MAFYAALRRVSSSQSQRGPGCCGSTPVTVANHRGFRAAAGV